MTMEIAGRRGYTAQKTPIFCSYCCQAINSQMLMTNIWG